MVDNKQVTGEGAKVIIATMNDYRKELDDMDHTIDIIINQIDKMHSLSEDEHREYKQTLKYILKD